MNKDVGSCSRQHVGRDPRDSEERDGAGIDKQARRTSNQSVVSVMLQQVQDDAFGWKTILCMSKKS